MKTFISDISGKHYPETQRIRLILVKSNIVDFIKNDYPNIDENSSISLEELGEYRQKYIETSLRNEFDQLTTIQKEVITKVTEHEILAEQLDDTNSSKLTIGQKIADKVAAFGGSWKFIISFGIFIIFWICVNTFAIFSSIFDPYPFILLNLFLSCLAALQAPVIMMSQNRQEEKDRLRAKEDYKVNLKSELEIRLLQDKIDHLLLVQQQRLFEIQNIQIEMLQEISKDISDLNNKKDDQ